MHPGKWKFLTWFSEGVAISISAHFVVWLGTVTAASTLKFFGHIVGVAAVNVLVSAR
jgi:hypothetical protein